MAAKDQVNVRVRKTISKIDRHLDRALPSPDNGHACRLAAEASGLYRIEVAA